MRKRSTLSTVLLFLLWGVVSAPTLAATDWPTWRYDAARSAATPEELPANLRLEWSFRAPTPAPAWPEDARLQFDAAYEPIVLGRRVFLPSNRSDSLSALDIESGAALWRFYTDGPIRLAPVGIDDRLYVGCDDGSLYCLRADTGDQVWRFTPTRARRVLGNGRLVSVQPVRGGPVLAGDRLHFTTGVWPFEGTFLHSVEVTDPTASHTVQTLLDVAPQGYLVAADGQLFLPAGRAKVSSVDAATGAYETLHYDAKGQTDYHASANGAFLFHGQRIVDRAGGRMLEGTAWRPVTDGSMMYASEKGAVRAADLEEIRGVEAKDRKGDAITRWVLDDVWRVDNEALANAATVRDLRSDEDPARYEDWLAANPLVVALKAGARLYGYQRRTLFSIDLPPSRKEAPAVSWRRELEETPVSLVAANQRLLVATREGSLLCFSEGGGDREDARSVEWTWPEPARSADHRAEAERAAAEAFVRHCVEAAGTREGYCVLLGAGDGRRLAALVRRTDFHVVVLEADPMRSRELRTEYDRAGLYGGRVSLLSEGDLLPRLPPYLACLITSGSDRPAEPWERGGMPFAALFALLRPYGGAALLPLSSERHAELESWVRARSDADATIARVGAHSILKRPGALPGAADWKREYGDEANTLMSRDSLVRAPLGILWFGGPAGDANLYYNRHNWPPGLTVLDGRMFVQGPGVLASIDVYTGRVLWRREIVDGGGSPARRTDLTSVSADRMGNPIFGTPPAGFHFLVEPDALYLSYPDRCEIYDPATGRTIGELELPWPAAEWGRIRVDADLLIVPVVDAAKSNDDQRLPRRLAALDRHSGDVRWTREARHAFPFITLGRGRILCFDSDFEKLYRDKRRGNAVPDALGDKRLVALELASGKELWSRPIDMVATWLAFSDQHNTLIASNSEEIRAFHGSDGYPLWRKKARGEGFKGHPENLVHKVILWHDRVIDQRGPGLAYDLQSGVDIEVPHPLTDEPVAWEFTKIGHHCNYAIASEHLLTFRAASAGFLDLATGGTSRLDGFRSGCRNSLIPANGVLNAPNFANGCVCSYSIFTSLALVHVPENEKWSYSAFDAPKERIRRLGINLNAPGDRRASGGTLWLGYPDVAGPSPGVAVTLTPEKPKAFRHHARQLGADQDLAWVYASGATGLTGLSIGLASPSSSSPEGAVTAAPPARYTVRLYFYEPAGASPGERVFNVSLQGEEVLRGFDVARATSDAGTPGDMREFHAVPVRSELRIGLEPESGDPVLSGVEVLLEE